MKLLLSFLLVVFTFAAVPAHASRINLLPNKILLQDRERSADLTLFNLTNKTTIARIEILSYRQKPTGEYEVLETPLNPAFDPESVIRLSPRQFTLPPGGRQKVRMSIQKPADLPPGEYRFHIKAISYDQEDFSVRRREVEGTEMQIKMNLGVVIPVIVRHGDVTSTAKLENVSLTTDPQTGGGPALKIDVVRTGTAGVTGKIQAFNAQMREIGILSNVNVFSEINRRTLVMPLKEMPTGNIHLRYTDDMGKTGVLDELVVQR